MFRKFRGRDLSPWKSSIPRRSRTTRSSRPASKVMNGDSHNRSSTSNSSDQAHASERTGRFARHDSENLREVEMTDYRACDYFHTKFLKRSNARDSEDEDSSDMTESWDANMPNGYNHMDSSESDDTHSRGEIISTKKKSWNRELDEIAGGRTAVTRRSNYDPRTASSRPALPTSSIASGSVVGPIQHYAPDQNTGRSGMSARENADLAPQVPSMNPHRETFHAGMWMSSTALYTFQSGANMSDADYKEAQEQLKREQEKQRLEEETLRTEALLFKSKQKKIHLESTEKLLEIQKRKRDFEDEEGRRAKRLSYSAMTS